MRCSNALTLLVPGPYAPMHQYYDMHTQHAQHAHLAQHPHPPTAARRAVTQLQPSDRCHAARHNFQPAALLWHQANPLRGQGSFSEAVLQLPRRLPVVRWRRIAAGMNWLRYFLTFALAAVSNCNGRTRMPPGVLLKPCADIVPQHLTCQALHTPCAVAYLRLSLNPG